MTLLSWILLTTTFFAVHSFSAINEDEKDVNDVCMTDACKRTAERIINNMDPEIKPCDDFYQFSCGKFIKAGLPKGKSSVSSMTRVKDIVNSQIRELLEAPIEQGELDAYKISKTFYTLCLKEENSKLNLTEARTLLRSVGWPVIGGWKEGEWSMHDQETKIRNLTFSEVGLFHVEMQPDLDTRRYLITMDQPRLTRRFLRNWELQELVDVVELPLVRAYEDYMVDIAVLFGAHRHTAEQQLRDILLFELDLEKIIDMPRGRHRPYELMTVAELQGRAGWVDWPALLAAAVVPKSLSLNTDELVKVYEPGYLDRLRRLIEKYPNRVVANFLGWRMAEWLSLKLAPEMDARMRQFYPRVGLEVMEPWEKCLQWMNIVRLQLAVSAMYVKKYMAEDNIQLMVSDMTANIRDQMYTTLKAQDWMEDDTKTRALLKLCRMKEYIGYPIELIDNKTMNAIYEGLNLDQALDFRTFFNTLYWWLRKFGNKRMKANWVVHGMSSSSPDAFYNPELNLLPFGCGYLEPREITAAFLQPPIFIANLPKYMYYSSVGTVAGHEITHGFDNNGLKFDADGKLVDWWDESSKMNYAEKSKCLLNQYTKYLAENSDAFKTEETIPFYRADNQSLGEIIADNGGLKLAYNAYKKYSAQLKAQEPLLPNLEQYTRDQMFFIELSNLFCSVVDIKAMQKTVRLSDPHPPGQFRINALFQNFPQFSEAFNCAAETNMNPKDKCSVW